MDRQLLAQGVPVLRECFGCGSVFSQNHHCPATNEKCSECNEFGHYTGFCLQWKFPPLVQTSNNTSKYRENKKSNLINSPEHFRRNVFNSVGKNNQDCEQEKTDITAKCEGMPLEGHSNNDLKECMPQDKGSNEEANVYENIPTTLQEQMNEVVQREIRAIKAENNVLQDSLDYEKILVKRYEKKLNMYRNSSLKKALERLENLKGELEKSKEEIIKVKTQRNQLFEYAMKVQDNASKAIGKITELTTEQCNIVDLMQEYYQTEMTTLPSWYTGPCKNCGSTSRHHLEHCLAHGNVCKVCSKRNHFTAMCNSADLLLKVTSEEMDLLGCVEAELNIQ